MNNEQRTNKAFTLIELVVSVAILAMVASFAGVIFKVSIESYRVTAANAEIMQKLRAVTDQLNRDFAGIRKDAPMAIQFWMDTDGTRTRCDSIAFFANGDFQSVRQYEYRRSDGSQALRTVSGNVASIYYGRRSGPDPNILARKQKILTSDTSLIGSPLLSDADEFLIDSLAVWRVNLNADSFMDWVVNPPRVNPYLPYLEEDLPLYMVEGVAEFMIQVFAGVSEDGRFVWLPDDSVFDDDDIFGFFYNVPLGRAISEGRDNWYDQSMNWPKAIKFTFTLYDSKGIIEGGRTFTHIVYLEK